MVTGLYKANTIYFLILLLWTPNCVQYFETFMKIYLFYSADDIHPFIHVMQNETGN